MLEASIVKDIEIYGLNDIAELISHLRGQNLLTPVGYNEKLVKTKSNPILDFSDIKGQEKAKRAMEIAAVGGHNVLLIGPPGSGKSMLAKAFVGILPNMTYDEIIEATKVHSVAGRLNADNPVMNVRPFRSPHHTVSHVGIVGGGITPNPGEVSLAHNGVLFLDELTEFNKKTLEALRQPIEDKEIVVARANYKLTYPCKFLLVCAMNPCPCGYYGSDHKDCTCSSNMVKKYLDKISGPLLDRIDIQIEVPAMKFNDINSNVPVETSEQIRQRVNTARAFAKKRRERLGLDITRAYKKENCSFTKEADAILEMAFDKLLLSARGYDRIVKIARTIADLSLCENVEKQHILEAVQLRSLDRKYFSNF